MQNFINSVIYGITNGIRKYDSNPRITKERSRERSTTSTKGKDSAGTYERTCKESFGISWRSIEGFDSRGYLSTLRRIRFKSKQCESGSRNFTEKVWKEAKQVLGFIPLFFLYNPQVLYTFFYIDSLFMDELISINIIQLNHVYSMLHNPTNI